MKPQHFLNLFGGLEWLPYEFGEHPDVHYTRIQSTACEQKRWDFIIRDLDHTLLFFLSQGYPCIIYDVSSKKTESRAIYQGLVFVKFVLGFYWLHEEPAKISVRGQDCTAYFYSQLHALSREAESKIKTYRKFLRTEELRLYAKCAPATIVDNYTELFKMLEVFFPSA